MQISHPFGLEYKWLWQNVIGNNARLVRWVQRTSRPSLLGRCLEALQMTRVYGWVTRSCPQLTCHRSTCFVLREMRHTYIYVPFEAHSRQILVFDNAVWQQVKPDTEKCQMVNICIAKQSLQPEVVCLPHAYTIDVSTDCQMSTDTTLAYRMYLLFARKKACWTDHRRKIVRSRPKQRPAWLHWSSHFWRTRTGSVLG